MVWLGESKLLPARLKALDTALEVLSGFLEKTSFVAADHLTIADFSILASLATAEACEHDLSRFPRVVEYMQRCKKEVKGYAELNQDGANQFGDHARPLLQNARATA